MVRLAFSAKGKALKTWVQRLPTNPDCHNTILETLSLKKLFIHEKYEIHETA
jgi:hypothetical protein